MTHGARVLTFYVGADYEGFTIDPARVASVLLSFGMDAFTFHPGTGYWRGRPERVAVISLILPHPNPPDIGGRIARRLGEAHGQKVVTWTATEGIMAHEPILDALHRAARGPEPEPINDSLTLVETLDTAGVADDDG